MKYILAVLFTIVIIIALGIGMWNVKRWFNWKFGYGRMIEPRIEKLETRIYQLEQKISQMER